MTPTELVSDDELRRHHCLERVDVVPGDPDTTAFKRRSRLQQAEWRDRKKLEIGTQPMRPKDGQRCRDLGSRLNLRQARESGANFLNNKVRKAVHERIGHPELYQTLNEDRLFSDLLSSMPMCFNLFGSLHGDLEAADRAVHCWWPDASGRVSAMRFEWSPGRGKPGEYLENRSAFDVAFELTLDDGSLGVVGIETKYHEHCKSESVPKESRLKRYREVTSNSSVFKPEALSKVLGTDLQQVWLDHLLALSMLQHHNRQWRWAKFVLVHPGKNPSYARAARRYGALLEDLATFEVRTIESMLDARVLHSEAEAAFRERYLW